MKIHQRTVGSKVIIGSVDTEVGISDGGARHVDEVDNLLKIGRRAIGGDVVNGEELDGEEKSKMHCIFNQKDQQIT